MNFVLDASVTICNQMSVYLLVVRNFVKRLLSALVLMMLPTLVHACPGLLDHSYTSLQGKPVNL